MTLLEGIASVTFLSKLDNGQAVSNTFHVGNEGSGVPDLTTLNGLATDIGTWCATQYKVMLCTVDTLVHIRASQVRSPGSEDPLTLYDNVLNAAGSTTKNSGGRGPYSVCGDIKLQTFTPSRRARGHMLMPPPNYYGEAATSSFSGAGTYLPAMQAFAAKLAAGCTLSPSWTGSTLHSWSLNIYSRAAQAAGDPSAFVCSNVVADTAVHWLRRRERGTS